MKARSAASTMRRTLGMAVFSGMLGVTLFGIFLTPVFYVLLRTRRSKRLRTAGAATPPAAVPPQPQPAGGGDE